MHVPDQPIDEGTGERVHGSRNTSFRRSVEMFTATKRTFRLFAASLLGTSPASLHRSLLVPRLRRNPPVSEFLPEGEAYAWPPRGSPIQERKGRAPPAVHRRRCHPRMKINRVSASWTAELEFRPVSASSETARHGSSNRPRPPVRDRQSLSLSLYLSSCRLSGSGPSFPSPTTSVAAEACSTSAPPPSTIAVQRILPFCMGV